MNYGWRSIFAMSLAFGACGAQAQTGATKPPSSPPKNQGPTKSPSAQTGVVSLFAEGQKLYNAGKYNEALVVFDHIIKKYPGHEPSIIQYAKTLYRLDRIPESYNLFARINPQYLDPETSYEYGYAFYTKERWDGAFYAFKKVPAEHALYDLANYYGALSAVKLKKYAEAEDMLDKAVVLPDKLARSRDLYLKHVQSLRHLQEKTTLDQSAADEKSRLQAEQQRSKQTKQVLNPSKPMDEPKEYAHEGFLDVDRVAEIKVKEEHQLNDMHGYSTQNFDNKTSDFTLKHGPLYPLPWRQYGTRRSAVGFALGVGVEDSNSTGKSQRLVAYEDSRSITRTVETDLGNTHTTTGSIGGVPWIELALPDGWWTGLSAKLNFDYVNFSRGQRVSQRGASPHVGLKWASGPLKGSVFALYQFEQLTDADTVPMVTRNIGDLVADITFPSDTNLSAEVKSILFDYQLNSLTSSQATTSSNSTAFAGPDSSYSGTLKVTQKFPLGFKFVLAGTAEQENNDIVTGLPTYGTASADGTIYTGKVDLVANPFPWFKLTGEYVIASSKWTVRQADRTESFKRNVSDYMEDSFISASLLFNF